MTNKYCKIFLRLVMSCGCLIYLIYKVDWQAIAANTRNLHHVTLLLVALFILLGTIIKTVQWFLLLKDQRIDLSFRRLLALNLVALFYSQIIPGSASGDLVKFARMWGDEKNRKNVLYTIALDKIIHLLVMALFSVFAVFCLFSDMSYWVKIALLISTFVIIFIFFLSIFLKKFTSRLTARWSKMFSINCKIPGFITIISAIILAVLFVIIGGFVHSLVARDLGYGFNFMAMIFTFSISSFILIIPASIAGLGIKEYTFIYLLGITSAIGESQAFVISITITAMRLLIALIGGIMDIIFSFSKDRV